MRSGNEPGSHGDHGGGHHGFRSAEDWAAVLDDSARDAWQQPERVIDALELTPTMTVADVGAGTGYFAVRLAREVPEGTVIATEVETSMVAHLNERARGDGLPNLRARVADRESALAARSVDRILVVHVWHHLADRVAHARELASALRSDGRLYIVEFSVDGSRGPPPGMRLDPARVIAELEAAALVADLSAIAAPDQYIVVARRPPAGADPGCPPLALAGGHP